MNSICAEKEDVLISPRKATSALKVERVEGGSRQTVRDRVAVEEPMEVRVEYASPGGKEIRSVSVTMRTPGHDFELASGFLFSEGFLSGREAIHEVTYCQSPETQEYNIVTVRLRDGHTFSDDLLNRNFYTSSSCGVCGKASLEAVSTKGCEVLPRGLLTLEASLLLRLPDLLLKNQKGFQKTGGLHAAGLFDEHGTLTVLREDVGRHNAVDKVIGKALLDGDLPLENRILVVSGRTSFEILQKTVSARIPVLVAVGAPSTLAVELARKFNVTLVGFARGERFNLYAGGDRVGNLTTKAVG
jgi:FdhD protein